MGRGVPHRYEGRVAQRGQAAGKFGLAAARGAYHQDVLGRHFVPKRVGQALPPPAVAQRNGDSPLGLLLTDNMFVPRGHNGSGGKGVVHHLLLFSFVPIGARDQLRWTCPPPPPNPLLWGSRWPTPTL